MIVYNANNFISDIKVLADKIKKTNKYDWIYGIPRGGVNVAIALSQEIGIPLISDIGLAGRTLIADDIIDSGKIRMAYSEFDFASLHLKPHADIISALGKTYFVNKTDDWIHYFWENNTMAGEDIVTRMLELIGENPNRPGLKNTPVRVVKMWKEVFKGYDETQKPKITIFPNDGSDGFKYDTMLTDEGYFFSHCEHHVVPFFGQYYFGYIPRDFLLGASKIARTVDYFSARLQIAERLVSDIINHLDKKVESKGMILVMKARHLCKEMRGVKKFNSPFEATAVTGYFAENKDGCKDEFIMRIR